MKSKFCSVIICAALIVLITGQAIGQYPEDAIRLGQAGSGVGTRALGMGNAYTGVASDYSAMYWNPAGLTQLQFSEFSFGLSHLSVKDVSTFFRQEESYSSNGTNLNTLGLVYKVPTRRGSMAIAFGYHRQNSFTGGMSFEGYNPNSSIITYYDDRGDDIPYKLWLADTVGGAFWSPITGRVTQLAKVLESGGLNNWSVAGAVDIAKDLSVGVTLAYSGGTYRYDRSYTEEDTKHVYEVYPYDFSKLTLDEYIEGDISSSLGAKFGLMYRIPDRFRLGVSVKTPTTYTVKETYDIKGRSSFDSSFFYKDEQSIDIASDVEYDVVTPWEYSVGASFMLSNLTVSGDLDFIDWSELRFANANSDIMSWNRDMKTIFRSILNYRAGLEYELPGPGIRLRGGFMHYQSPYQGDPANFDKNYITGGLGFLLGPSTMLDLGYAHGWWNTYRVNYDATSRTDEKITTDTFMGTLSYRF
jgi:long-subunit fatty acid transport protein